MGRPFGIPSTTFKDETGNKYGRLAVIARANPDIHGRARWHCKCDCGKDVTVGGWKLRLGNVKSCGCYRRDATIQRRTLTAEERNRRVTEPRKCTKCQITLPPEEFGCKVFKTWCKRCTAEIQRNWRKRDDNGTKSNWITKYCLTMEEYFELFRQQDGKCAICQRLKPDRLKYFIPDHCHKKGRKKGCVRGLLCNRCNTAIGLLGDDIPFIRTALIYLEKYYKSQETT